MGKLQEYNQIFFGIYLKEKIILQTKLKKKKQKET
jgi:hypothetical protein